MTITTDTEHLPADLRTITERLLTEEPQEIRDLRTGSASHRPGSYGQYFTAWDLANGILRDYAMNLYQLLRIAADTDVSVQSLVTVFRSWGPVYSQYLEYNGFVTLARQAATIVDSNVHDREAFIDVLSAFTAYVNRLTAWSHHYFPWHLGAQYRYSPEHSVARSFTPIPEAPPVPPSPAGPSIRLLWQPLGIDVVAGLECDLNEHLCSEFLAALPFTVLQQHAVVTGESMYAWAPLVSLAPTPVRERICDAPTGRLRFSQATGNKLIIQYGPTTETLSAPVLGLVAREDIGKLPEVGRAAWESAYRTKQHIWLTVEPL